jgi:hypothetical protein
MKAKNLERKNFYTMPLVSAQEFINRFRESEYEAATLINEENVKITWENERVPVGEGAMKTVLDFVMVKTLEGTKNLGLLPDIKEEFNLYTYWYVN